MLRKLDIRGDSSSKYLESKQIQVCSLNFGEFQGILTIYLAGYIKKKIYLFYGSRIFNSARRIIISFKDKDIAKLVYI